MPSNNELKGQATELAKELGIEVSFDGLKNDGLASLVKDLRAKATDAETTTQADDAPPAENEVGETGLALMEEVTEPEPTRKKGSVYVAEGKALSTKRGILGPGEEVFVEDTPDGKTTIEYFLKSGHLVKG